MRTVKFFGTVAPAMLLTSGSAALARDGQRPRGNHAPRPAQPHTRATERQRTEAGHARRYLDRHGGPDRHP